MTRHDNTAKLFPQYHLSHFVFHPFPHYFYSHYYYYHRYRAGTIPNPLKPFGFFFKENRRVLGALAAAKILYMVPT